MSVEFVWKPHPFKEILKGEEVNALCKASADAIAASANAALSPGGYHLRDFEVKPMMDGGFVVRTKTDHARASQRKNDTLLRALGAGRQ